MRIQAFKMRIQAFKIDLYSHFNRIETHRSVVVFFVSAISSLMLPGQRRALRLQWKTSKQVSISSHKPKCKKTCATIPLKETCVFNMNNCYYTVNDTSVSILSWSVPLLDSFNYISSRLYLKYLVPCEYFRQ